MRNVPWAKTTILGDEYLIIGYVNGLTDSMNIIKNGVDVESGKYKDTLKFIMKHDNIGLPNGTSTHGQVLYLVEIMEAVIFNQRQVRLGCLGRVSSLFAAQT